MTGKLISKSNEQQITDSFKKREFVIEVVDGAYSQQIKFQLTQNNCDKITQFGKDAEIKVTFNIRGKGFEKDGKMLYFNNLDAWKVEAAGNETAVGTVQQVAMAAPQEVKGGNIPDPVDSSDLPF